MALTETVPVPVNGTVAVKVAVNTSGLAVAVRAETMPLAAVMSLAVKPTGASLKVKVTCEVVSATLSALSTILTTTEGDVEPE